MFSALQGTPSYLFCAFTLAYRIPFSKGTYEKHLIRLESAFQRVESTDRFKLPEPIFEALERLSRQLCERANAYMSVAGKYVIPIFSSE